jgi:hypothetical protein
MPTSVPDADRLSCTRRVGLSSYCAAMTAKSLGTLLAIVGAFVLVGGVVLLVTSAGTDDAPGSSIAASWCIVVAGAANIASGFVLRRQVWRRK